MVNQLVTHMLKASAPAPSIETILHGLMPQKFVDHTHADAVLSVSNTKDGEETRSRGVRQALRSSFPYLMPGFDLGPVVRKGIQAPEHAQTVGMVLLSHGIFSFRRDPRAKPYERMIELVTLAEDYLDAKDAWLVVPNRFTPGRVSADAQADLRRKLLRHRG